MYCSQKLGEDFAKFCGLLRISISSCQRNLMKTYHNEANTSGITKIAILICKKEDFANRANFVSFSTKSVPN